MLFISRAPYRSLLSPDASRRYHSMIACERTLSRWGWKWSPDSRTLEVSPPSDRQSPRRSRRAEEKSVDWIVRMLVAVAHHLEAREGSDGGAQRDVACPVRIVVHARGTDECRASVHHRRNDPCRARPPALRLARHGRRRRECRRSVARWKRLIFSAAPAAAEPEVMWTGIGRYVRPGAAGEILDRRGQKARIGDGLSSMQAKVGRIVPATNPPHHVHRQADHHGAGIAEVLNVA